MLSSWLLAMTMRSLLTALAQQDEASFESGMQYDDEE
jgi:hypothetical protein